MAELIEVPLTSIDPNPFRLLGTYPYNEKKIETLMRSIADVGLWEGVIARPHGNRFQLAFGHHRIEAGRRNKLSIVPVIVRDLDDTQMLQFMGRENGEDYNADFLVMLEGWQATSDFLSRDPAKKAEAIDIARLLGWTRRDATNDGSRLNETASACSAALALITAGHLTRDDLRDLSVSAVVIIVDRTLSRIELTERLGKKGGLPAKDIEKNTRDVARAAKTVAKDVREGDVTHKQIRSEIDFRSYKNAREKGRQSPLFGSFADGVAASIHKMLVDDKAAEKLREMEQSLPIVELDEDFASLRRVDFALAEHETVSGKWRTRLTRKGDKVVPFKLLKKEGG